MAGTITHLLISRKYLEQHQPVTAENWGSFMLGNCFPDAAYWPGEKDIISDLSHYLLAAKLPEIFYQKHKNDKWRAFAKGWLFHLKTDLVLHPVVNKIAGRYLSKTADDNGEIILTYEDNKPLHALIETNLDVMLLRKGSLGKPNPNFYNLENLNDTLMAETFYDAYGINLDRKELEKLLLKLPKRIKSLINIFKKKAENSLLITFLKGFLAFPLMFAKQDFRQLLTAYLEEIELSEMDQEIYLSSINDLLSDDKIDKWFEDFWNFDTGKLCRLGEYEISDQLFNRVEKEQEAVTEMWTSFKKIFDI